MRILSQTQTDSGRNLCLVKDSVTGFTLPPPLLMGINSWEQDTFLQEESVLISSRLHTSLVQRGRRDAKNLTYSDF